LKRKENTSTVSFEILSAQKPAIPDETINRNNINMLEYRFCAARSVGQAGTDDDRAPPSDQRPDNEFHLYRPVVMIAIYEGIRRMMAPRLAQRIA